MILNLNFLRTILTWLAGVVVVIGPILGCKTDAITGAVSCAGSWIGPEWASIVAVVLLALNQLLKAFQGGTMGTGLVAPTVVVSSSGAPGTVSRKQVETDSSGAKKT